MFDILYVTWFIHLTTALISAKFWYLYWVVRLLRRCASSISTGLIDCLPQIPLYALYRLATFALPYISPSLAAALNGGNAASAGGAPGAPGQDAAAAPSSKRQEKLRKRMERGDPRIQQREMRPTR